MGVNKTVKFKKYWSGKSPKQRFYLIILAVLILIFIVFLIKGNFIDSGSENRAFFLDFGDIIALVGATTAYILLKIHNNHKNGGK